MARLTIPSTGKCSSDASEICAFLKPYGIWYECWDTGKPRVAPEADASEILAAYQPEIDALKAKGGYVTADLINVSPDTEGLDAMLAKFSKEHTHSEDEVRFCVRGNGVFHINPETSPVFAIEMEAGDLINVPAGTRHWFNLCENRSIRVIRMFLDPTGWTPHYLEDRVDQNYEVLCFSQTKPEQETLKSVVKP